MAFPVRLMDKIMAPSATVYERSLAKQAEELLGLSPERIRTLWNPWACHIDDLPFLAWTLSVDIWDPTWDEQRKRSVVARSIELHRLKGTLAGMEEYAKLVGSEVVRSVVPPAGFVLAPSQTQQEREAWIATLPQVRIYRDRVNGTARGKFWIGKGLTERRHLDETPGPEKTGRRAVLWRNGAETHVSVDEQQISGAVIASMSIPKGPFAYWGRKTHKVVLAADKARSPVWVLNIQDGPTPTPNPLPPGPKLQTVTPTFESEVLPAGDAFRFDDKALNIGYLREGPRCNIYYRIPIIDPMIDGTKGRGLKHYGALDVDRFSMDPHTAELSVLIPGKAPKRAWSLGRTPIGSAFWDTDYERLGKTFGALRSAKRLSDKVVVNTKITRPLIAGTPIFAGEAYRAGDWTRS